MTGRGIDFSIANGFAAARRERFDVRFLKRAELSTPGATFAVSR